MKLTSSKAIVIGVSGIMGSGKTAVSRIFERLGATRIDADSIGKALLKKEGIRNQLISRFGEEITDGREGIVAAKLAQKAFRDRKSVRELNRIIHPYLIGKLKEEVGRLKKDFRTVVVDAALLPEWDLGSLIDLMIVVDSPVESSMSRACKARNLTRNDVTSRMNLQFSRNKKRKFADVILPNYGSIDDLNYKAQKLFEFIIKNLL